jgi:uncharacterized protein YozE (UPF0346 family)
MKFETWLKKQKNRDDPVGDLACDYIDDLSGFNRNNPGKKFKLTKEYLVSQKACDEALEAFDEAIKEYETVYNFN